ncbi:MAG: enoyl-CoA hydratase-related protein [Acidimicrobiales bacterium]
MTAPNPGAVGFTYEGVPGLLVVLDDKGVLHLTLDRPDKRNVIDDQMMAAMIDALDAANRDERVRVVVLGGTGDHFCGGADIVARNAPGGDRPRVGSIQRRVPSMAHRLIPLLLTIQVPVVCGVKGWAAGIGFQLALAADFTIVAKDAHLWEPFLARGFTPDSGATWLLPRLIGMVKARQLLLLGRQLTGQEAADWGLVHDVVRSVNVDAEVELLADQLVEAPTVAVGLTKWLLHAGTTASLTDHLADEAFALELSSRSEDFREGLTAFQEKRPPDFKGR